jgi:uncharacterized repeat protein (TIGR03803 family)
MKTESYRVSETRLTSVVSTTLLSLMLYCGSAGAADRQVLRGHVPPAVAKLGLKPVGRLPATNQLRLAIGLPLRNTNELELLPQELYDPGSPRFRQYLTPEQFTERFGPRQEDYEAVKQFAVQHGLQVTATFSNRVVLDVMGPVPQIENTFNIKLQTYQHPREARQFYAPDVEPSVPAGVAVLDVSGLNNYSIPRPTLHITAASTASPQGTGSGPGGTFLGKDLRNAYAPGASQTGIGQMVGLLAFAAYAPTDVSIYEDTAGLPHVPLQPILLDGFDGTPGGLGTAEADLDIDMAISMAPALAKVVIFDAGPSGNLNDILNRMAASNQVRQFSSSWAGFGPPHAASDEIFQQMALQGQSFFQASGDGDSWNDDPVAPYYLWPDDDPYVTSVGGTSLTMTGDGASYASETVWNYGYLLRWSGSAGVGSTGGISTLYALPAWQKGLNMSANRGSTKMRNYPDVSMLAGGYAYVFNGSTYTGGWGTSFAAPLWAGFTALVNQEAAANGDPAVGFLNPALYALGQSPSYTHCFHDITNGNNDPSPVGPIEFPAVPGYDLCTGWGTPKGSNLIEALALRQRLGITPSAPLAFTNSVGGTGNPSNLSFILTNRSGSLVWVESQDVPWLDVSPAYGTLLGGGAATVVAVAPNSLASNLAAGGYMGTLFFTNLSDQSVVTRQVTLAVAGPPVITGQPSNLTLLEGLTASFTVDTASDALLTFQWEVGNGVTATNLADGGNISGSATSTLTISDVSLGDSGTYSVIVSNSAGGVSSAGASLNVLTGQAPMILSQSSSQTVLPGATANLTVTAAGDQPLSYFWQLNGTNLANGGNISGTGSSALQIANTTLASAGSYSVVITNSFGSVTSAVAVLNISGVTASGAALEALYSFTASSADSSGSTYGAYPMAGLLQARGGSFYGTASGGGAAGYGTVFRLTPNGAVSLVYSFNDGNDGAVPFGGLIQGTNGSLYGTTAGAGDYGDGLGEGSVFRMTTAGAGTYYSLNSASSGASPFAGLVQGQDGNFYGTSAYSGAYGLVGYGAVFKLTPAGALTALGEFNFESGANPASALVQAADGNFYGTAQNGGANGGFGTIFQITSAGTITALHSFANTDGAGPIAGLTQDTDGSFYGTTYSGGASNAGTVFKLSSDGTFTSLYSFTGGDDGSNSYGGLLLANDGDFYGTTEGGGVYGLGTVFRISRNGALTTLVNFDGYQGAVPECTLIQGTDGNLYGTTQFGGAEDFGAIFRLSLNGALQITEQPQNQQTFAGGGATFSVATFGGLPVSYQWLSNGVNLVDGGSVSGANARLLTLTNISAGDAAIYSVVVSNSSGQVSSAGAVLEVNSSAPMIVSQPQSQTTLVGTTAIFSAQATGDGPLDFQWQENGTNLVDGGNISGSATSSLTLASVAVSNTGMYSVAVSNTAGSVTSSPALLKVLPATAPTASLSDVVLFTNASGGSLNPYAGVIQGTDGNFYGTSLNGGSEGFGSVFKLDIFGASSVLYSFTNGSDGASPFTGLVQASDGNFYGASFQGFASPFGALFKLTPTGAFSSLYSFMGGADGGNPIGSLVQGNDGDLYGTASTGGSNGFGEVFRLSAKGAFTPLWSFQSFDGSHPAAPLLPNSQGNFYGATALGGSNNLGTVFILSTNGVVTSLASFDYIKGAYPSNGLVQAADGNFYGTASAGGTNGGWGTVFQLMPGGSLTALHSFNYQDGAVPVGGLVQGTDGNLYGTTSLGGAGGQGTVFEITTNGAFTTLYQFSGFDGANPQSTLIQASDGLFYGTAEFGGNQFAGANQTGDGLVFRLASDSLVVTPSTGFSAARQPGGPFSPPAETFVLTNTSSSSLTWSVLNLAGSWLVAQPADGVLASHTSTNVVVSFSAAASLLGNANFATNIVFSNWNTHVSQIELFELLVGQTIVRNGGFETGDFTDWTLVGDTVIDGINYNVVLNKSSGYEVVHSGNYGAFLGDGTLSTLSQTLPTTAGQPYLLSLWLDNPLAASGQQFEISWNGATLYNVVNPPIFAWRNLQFIVTANGASTVLEIEAANGPNYFGLDDISVTPIPLVAFQSAAEVSNGFSLTWSAAGGLSYLLQYKTNLLQPEWVNLGTPTVGNGFPLTITDTDEVQSSTQRYYRLRVSP